MSCKVCGGLLQMGRLISVDPDGASHLGCWSVLFAAGGDLAAARVAADRLGKRAELRRLLESEAMGEAEAVELARG